MLTCFAAPTGFAAVFHFDHLGPEDGLAHNTANAVIQDREGFIWIATDDGLDRYDGYEFRHFKQTPAPGTSNVFVRLQEDDAGNIWIGTRGGLLRFDPREERFERIDLGPGAGERELEITALTRGADDRLWVAQGARLFVAESGRTEFRQVRELGDSGQSVTQAILAMAIDPSGQVWLLVGDPSARTTMVARVTAGDELEEYPLGEWESLGIAFHFDRGGRLWLAAGRHRTNVPRAHLLPAGIPRTAGVNSVIEAADGTVWLGTTGTGLFRISPDDPGTAQYHPLGDSWQENYALDLLIDRAGSLWVSTLAGLWRHDPGLRPFRHLGIGDGPGLDVAVVSSLLQGPDGALWIGTYGGGLSRWQPDSGVVETFRHDPGDPGSICDDTVWALHLDANGALWVGSAAALCRLDPATGDVAVVEPPQAWERPMDIRVLGGRGTDSILVGFSILGFWMLDTQTLQWRKLLEVDGQITSLESNGPDQAWLGFHTGFLMLVDLEIGTLERHDLRSENGVHFKNLNIYDIHRAVDGTLWLATDGGLGRFHPGSGVFEYPIAADILPGSVCFSLEQDAAGHLWIGTNRGLVRFDPAAPPGERVRVFDLSDGLGNIEFNRRAAYRSATGEMFLGGMTGVTAFRPDQVRLNPTPPPVALTRVTVLGRDGDREWVPRGLDRLTLDPGDQAVAFDFAALSYIAPEKNEYAYRMEGLDADWVAAGQRRFARYAGLAPGDYVFRVRGTNNHGVWSEVGASLPVTVAPAFWQTAWFRTAVVAALLGMLYLAHRVRVRRLLELEKVRLRIASDLHDELSGELSSIALSSAIARRQGYLEEPERQRLEEIESTSRQVIGGLRDLVWTINPEHDSLEATVRRMRSTASQLLEEHDWSFDENWTETEGGVAMTVRRDLHLVFKEALTNVVRHARANKVAVRLERMDDRLRLEVEDDGAGFDPVAASDGTGLASMRRRAGRLGARLVIRVVPGEGTRVRLDLPLGKVRAGGAWKGGESS